MLHYKKVDCFSTVPNFFSTHILLFDANIQSHTPLYALLTTCYLTNKRSKSAHMNVNLGIIFTNNILQNLLRKLISKRGNKQTNKGGGFHMFR